MAFLHRECPRRRGRVVLDLLHLVDVLMVHMTLDILVLDVYRTFGLLHVLFQDMASSAKDYWRQMSLKAVRLTIDLLCLYLQSTKYHHKSHREL